MKFNNVDIAQSMSFDNFVLLRRRRCVCTTAMLTIGLIMISFLVGCNEESETNATASTPTTKKSLVVAPSQTLRASTKSITVGPFSVRVPTEWLAFNSVEASSLRGQYLEQSRQIYQQYSGVPDDSMKPVEVAAFHILRDDGAFIMVSFAAPPQANLIPLLKAQASEKAQWGIRNGYLRKYLGLVPIDDRNLSGFIVTMIGNHGCFEATGGLQDKKFKNTMIQLTLISPKAWDEAMATNSLNKVLNSVTLNIRPAHVRATITTSISEKTK